MWNNDPGNENERKTVGKLYLFRLKRFFLFFANTFHPNCIYFWYFSFTAHRYHTNAFWCCMQVCVSVWLESAACAVMFEDGNMKQEHCCKSARCNISFSWKIAWNALKTIVIFIFIFMIISLVQKCFTFYTSAALYAVGSYMHSPATAEVAAVLFADADRTSNIRQ